MQAFSMETIIGLVVYALITSVTPGPNNLIVLSSVANHGLRRTAPLMLGMVVGFSLMIMTVGFGVSRVIDILPMLETIMIGASIIYTLYLALKIAQSNTVGDAENQTLMTALQGAAFQWINAKAWIMALASLAIFTPEKAFIPVMFVALVFGAVGLPCVYLWAWSGVRIQSFLNHGERLRIFNSMMAILLLLSVLPAVI